MTNIEKLRFEIENRINKLTDEYDQLAKYEVWMTAKEVGIKIAVYKSVLAQIDSLMNKQTVSYADNIIEDCDMLDCEGISLQTMDNLLRKSGFKEGDNIIVQIRKAE